MTNDDFSLQAYSVILKVSTALTIIVGVIVEGVIIYGWGQLTAYYNTAKVAWNAVTSQLTAGALALPELPLWPLALVVLAVLVVAFYVAITLWALSSWIDLQLSLAKEERDYRARQAEAMKLFSNNLTSIAQYFAALPPRK